MDKRNGKAALITGGSKGIGYGITAGGGPASHEPVHLAE
jgi:NADP-dependent 3-hydroxy acid dehydrogenase YdfG